MYMEGPPETYVSLALLFTFAIASAEEPTPLLERAAEIIDVYSVEGEALEALERVAVEAMLAELDRGRGLHHLLDAGATPGVGVGVGADFLVVPKRGLLIRHVTSEGPAWQAGVRATSAPVRWVLRPLKSSPPMGVALI